MSEEENNVLEYFKNNQVFDIELVFNYIPVLLNIIEKQQKEIEHWKAGMKIIERDKNNHIERLEKELNSLKEIEQLHQEENGKLRVELEQEKTRNEKLQYKIDEKELIIDGMKEDRRIAIEEIREEYYISKDKIKDFVSKKMKYLYVDSCAEDSGKYTAYKNVLNLLEEK